METHATTPLPCGDPGVSRKASGRTRALGVALLAAMAGACSPSAGGREERLVVTGSSTLGPLVAELASAYERAHPGVRIDVQSGGSSRGIADVRSGLADIGMVSRALQGEERTLESVTIARDGVGIIVNARNPVAALDEAEVKALYRGEIRSWAELGGYDAPVVVVHKAEGRATREVFLDHFGLGARAVRAHVIVGENEQAIKTVAGAPGAIGYVSIGTAAVDIEEGQSIRLVEVDGVTPTLANVRRGGYPMVRPLNLVTRAPAQGLARAFIDYVRSSAAAPTFRAQSFVQVDG